MFSAFSTAISALAANGVAVDAVGNNLANLNTPGYKATVAQFHDLLAQSIGAAGVDTQIGLGTGRPTILRQFTQGNIQSTSGPMDAAIQGGGFFVARENSGKLVFTRAGNFRLDSAGGLLTATGQKVQGWSEINGAVDTAATVGDISIASGALQKPFATAGMKLAVNLNGDPKTPADGTFSTPIEVVDSLGSTHVLTVKFTRTGPNAWKYNVTIPGAEVTGGAAGTPKELAATGTLTFDTDGTLKDPAPDGGTITIDVPGLKNGAADLKIDWALYDKGKATVTQFAQPSSVSATSQDGLQAAQLVRLGMSDGGKLVAEYTNGKQRVVGQVALAFIQNPETLVAVGDNNLQASSLTASAAIGPAETGGRGKIVAGALESSTVDVAQEFTNLIVFQRSYQANARVITTADELTQETLNLKR